MCQKKLTRVDDAVDEYFAWYQAVVILIHLAEQVGEAGFLVVHELQELDEWKEKAVSGVLSESSRGGKAFIFKLLKRCTSFQRSPRGPIFTIMHHDGGGK